MKSSFDRLRRFAALHKSDHKEKPEFLPSAQLDELGQASKDMQAMRNCYDSLLSAAAATANSAYEFSESLREMGTCLLEKTSHGDEETDSFMTAEQSFADRVLSMLGQVQFELHKLIDSYRSHIFTTIINPSESLFSELRNVEEMKRQCDEKRQAYEFMMTQQREKGKSKSGKVDNLSLQQIQRAQDEFEEEATLCVFRLKSLKQGQSRSLLTQAARHHAAQLNFFRKGVKSLEAVEPHVRMVTEEQHIDYQFSGLEDDGEDGEDDGADVYEAKLDGESSFDYRQDTRGLSMVSQLKNSMEVDDVNLSYTQSSTQEGAEVNIEKSQGDVRIREYKMGSHSAPLFPEKKFDPVEKARHVQQLSSPKSNSYVLPTPVDVKTPPLRTSNSATRSRPAGVSGQNPNLWHSSPLEIGKQDLKSVPEVRESTNGHNGFGQLPPPLMEGLVYNTEKVKRQAFSGPLTPMPKKHVLNASGPIFLSHEAQLVSGIPPRAAQPSSPKASPTASPPLVSSPRISELHELPRPPVNFAMKPVKSSGFIGHSAPLVPRNPEGSANSRIPSAASPLPPPPLNMPRSFSIPSSSQRAMGINVAKTAESQQLLEKVEEVSSPPLTPISLMDIKPVSNVAAYQPGTIRGE
ncbi:hypothetical protein EUGRSUZ_I01619 [Eucalyptus grandis]|uniref:BAR domain-containing protein n=2 Tax=Eucalyptus grandis TaxID=71139 RepID=A0A059APN2_EUCGR|nr:hypothetical protein EUGRSUZ_I01619 [Eucalyptus grandis]